MTALKTKGKKKDLNTQILFLPASSDNLNRFISLKSGQGLGRHTQLFQDRVGMLSNSGNRIHTRIKLIVCRRRNQGRQGAHRTAHFGPAVTRLELRMCPDVFHLVDTRIGDLRIFKLLDDLVNRHV